MTQDFLERALLLSVSQDDVVQVLEKLLDYAVFVGVSDIHIQPKEGVYIIRMRLHGVLFVVTTITIPLAVRLISYLKVLCHKDIMQTLHPQDGAFTTLLQKKQIDIRVSWFPSLHGEKVALRILAASGVEYRLNTLGFSSGVLIDLLHIAQSGQGFFLVTGPTGSGKTTTLYAMVQESDIERRNVITLEDPIEYHIAGVTQTQVNERGSFQYADAVRSLLRQDPDVALIGEIRESATATAALEAALTGHLVLSTLHTTHAVDVPIRLSQMGVSPYMVSRCLTGVLGQRLVPTLCAQCRYEDSPQLVEKEWLQQSALDFSLVWRARGCAACCMTGVGGRQIVAELFVPDGPARIALADGAVTEESLHNHAVRCGMISIGIQGKFLVQEGIISIETARYWGF